MIDGQRPVLLQVSDLAVDYRSGGAFGSRRSKRAVDGVSLELARGETLALVGESGSGKSTTGRAILKLTPITAGKIVLEGRDISTITNRADTLRYRRTVQVVFQDPALALNPSRVVSAAVTDLLKAHGEGTRRTRLARAADLFERVGLSSQHLQRHPSELSGGQRQRVGIARALCLEPSVIICDEAVSALDVSTQAQVINLLNDLQRDLGLSYLFIAHDLGMVRQISHRVAVMQRGVIVETATADQIFDNPQEDYTKALLDAQPKLNTDYNV